MLYASLLLGWPTHYSPVRFPGLTNFGLVRVASPLPTYTRPSDTQLSTAATTSLIPALSYTPSDKVFPNSLGSDFSGQFSSAPTFRSTPAPGPSYTPLGPKSLHGPRRFLHENIQASIGTLAEWLRRYVQEMLRNGATRVGSSPTGVIV